MPNDAKISDNQLKDATKINNRIENDPGVKLNKKEKNLLKRVDRYDNYKEQFYKENNSSNL